MIGWLTSLFSNKADPAPSVRAQMVRQRRGQPVPATIQDIRAEYDAAQTTTDNSRHWANADSLSADEANNPTVRAALRQRARYEAQENNSYAKGIVLTLANDTIGTGPRLQMLSPDRVANQAIERLFGMWSRRIRLASKLRTMRLAKAVDGECFAQFTTNSRLHGVQLDVALIEAEQVSSPFMVHGMREVDGVRFDESGNPTEYHLLDSHPGGSYHFGAARSGRWLGADQVIHLFRQDRPGQHRGVPEITPALPLFAQLRRFTLATIAAAETAANFAGVMRTTGSAIADPDDVDALDPIELERNALLTLPRGWDISQMRAEHPTTTYEMFRNAILNEIARCLNMPFNVAAGNSSSYNYASGRLDHQVYYKSIAVERSDWEVDCLDRILSEWFDEAVLLGLIPSGLGAVDEIPHAWHWDGREHVDPVKEASAQGMRLANGTTTLQREFASQGLDWEQEQANQAMALGLTVDEFRQLLVQKIYGIAMPSPVADEETDIEETP